MQRVHALTLIVLVVAWMVPISGSSCPSSAQSPANRAHVHSHDAGAGSHDHAAPDHSHVHDAGEARSSPASTPDDSTCCERRTSYPLAVQAALQDAQPRPTLLPMLLTVEAPAVTWMSEVRLLHQPPPPRPYAQTRRPLLI